MDGHFSNLQHNSVAAVASDELFVRVFLVYVKTDSNQVNTIRSVRQLAFYFQWLYVNACADFSVPRKQRKYRKEKHHSRSFGVAFIDMWVLMLSGPLRSLPFQKSERLFLATCFFSNMIFIGTFQVSVDWCARKLHTQPNFVCCRVHWKRHSPRLVISRIYTPLSSSTTVACQSEHHRVRWKKYSVRWKTFLGRDISITRLFNRFNRNTF